MGGPVRRRSAGWLFFEQAGALLEPRATPRSSPPAWPEAWDRQGMRSNLPWEAVVEAVDPIVPGASKLIDPCDHPCPPPCPPQPLHPCPPPPPTAGAAMENESRRSSHQDSFDATCLDGYCRLYVTLGQVLHGSEDPSCLSPRKTTVCPPGAGLAATRR